MRCPRCGVEPLAGLVLAKDGRTGICSVCAFIEEMDAADLPEACAKMAALMDRSDAAR